MKSYKIIVTEEYYRLFSRYYSFREICNGLMVIHLGFESLDNDIPICSCKCTTIHSKLIQVMYEA